MGSLNFFSRKQNNALKNKKNCLKLNYVQIKICGGISESTIFLVSDL